MFAHRFLGLPRGQHRNSLEGNVGRRVVVTSKKRFCREIIAFTPLFYQKWILLMLIQGKHISFCLKNLEICSKIY